MLNAHRSWRAGCDARKGGSRRSTILSFIGDLLTLSPPQTWMVRLVTCAEIS
jgi:hypothetical protein